MDLFLCRRSSWGEREVGSLRKILRAVFSLRRLGVSSFFTVWKGYFQSILLRLDPIKRSLWALEIYIYNIISFCPPNRSTMKGKQKNKEAIQAPKSMWKLKSHCKMHGCLCLTKYQTKWHLPFCFLIYIVFICLVFYKVILRNVISIWNKKNSMLNYYINHY